MRRFVADASHELRTPLAAVRPYAELFSRGAASRSDDLERSMRGVKRESERMSALVDELTLLAHLDEGQPLAREEVDLGTVVAEAVETARALDPERPIALATEPVVVFGDRARLRQLVDNLLANARAHTPTATRIGVTPLLPFPGRASRARVTVLSVTGSSDKPLWTGVAVLAIVLAFVGVVIRPFLFEPIAAILLLVASRQTTSQRLTRPGIIVITVCAVVGAAIAAAYSHALY